MSTPVSRRQNHIGQLQFFDFFNDLAWFVTQAGVLAHLAEALP
jgi:hypothetical protein